MAGLLIPGGLPGQSWMLVLQPGQSLDGLVLPAKGAASRLPRGVDFTAYIADLGLTVAGPIAIEASPGLAVTLLSAPTSPVVSLMVGGGVAGTVARMEVAIPLSQDGLVEAVLAVPIYDDGAVGLVPVPAPANDPLPALLAAIL